MPKTYWITDNRFKFIAILLMLIFFTLMALLYFKADEVTKDPCSICAKKMGEEVVCITGGIKPIQRTFYPNYSVEDKKDGFMFDLD